MGTLQLNAFAISLTCFIANASAAPSLKSISGRCTRIVVAGTNISKNCSGKVVNITYDNGRSGYWFVLKDGSILSFSGELAKSIFNKDGSALQPIDQVTFAKETDGAPPGSAVAIGACHMTDPSKGKAFLKCRAKINGDQYFEGAFVSDGFPPR